ncbi:hypothetical protein BH11VER1_BH11VER1_40910 [soil metagenome]
MWCKPRDTRWYLSDLGEKSINIGIGWEKFELHLFDARNDADTWQKASELLDEPDFHQLFTKIGPRCERRARIDKLLIANLRFDPLDSGADENFRARSIAWHAANQTDDFVEKTLAWIRRFTENEEMINLVRLLNQRSSIDTAE